MTSARSEQIDLTATPYYHCINRCVRRSYLCGIDDYNQRDYSHRKAWVVDRLKYLAGIFAIKICAYAVLSNHYHVVLHVNDKAANQWDEQEVIQRWTSIFPQDAKENQHLKSKIKQWRERLSSVSWFMRCLNEKIARAANDEDNCKGRFWEGRFKSQALLDEGALLSAMVYVDLNPVRAGIVKTPEESEFTSIYERIQYISQQLKSQEAKPVKQNNGNKAELYNRLKQPKSLVPFADLSNKTDSIVIDFKLSDYLELADHTGRIIRENKGSIPEHLTSILNRLQFNTEGWISLIKQLGSKFYHAVGSEIYLINFSKNRKRTVKGLKLSKKVYTVA